jgi:hypothetical protein
MYKMSGYNITNNPKNFNDLMIFSKPAPNQEFGTVVAKSITATTGTFSSVSGDVKANSCTVSGSSLNKQ